MGRPLAPQTRMLLASDGSTTTLLQAMLGEEVHLRLDEVSRRTGADIPPETRSALGVTSGAPVMVRRSGLVTRLGLEVSRNCVVACAGTGLVGQIMNAGVPIGLTMNGGLAGHRRIIVESGWATWDGPGPALPCAFKAYVIVYKGSRAMHIYERFNPHFVPTDGHDATGRDGDRGALAQAV